MSLSNQYQRRRSTKQECGKESDELDAENGRLRPKIDLCELSAQQENVMNLLQTNVDTEPWALKSKRRPASTQHERARSDELNAARSTNAQEEVMN